MLKILLRSLVICFLFSQNISAQLSDFSLSVVPTNETCTGNGTLTFNVSGATEGASFSYSIYKLPNTVTPIAVITENTFGGLTSGTYSIVATQTVGAQSNTQQQTVTITNTITQLAYQVAGNITCNDGVLTITATQGTAVAYEIISGPVIRPLQPSNTFTMLPAGVYTVRVFDACGDAVVQTYTLENPTAANMIISDFTFPDCPLINCTTVNAIASFISTSSNVNYPVTVAYTIYPPSGAPILQTIVVPSGNPTFFEIETGIPFFNNQAYNYDIQVTDNCGNTFTSLGNTIIEQLEMSAIIDTELCTKNIKISACNFIGPVTISFITAPAGFNPMLFNSNHPGPFAIVPISYLPSGSNVMPDGDYTIQLTDACGRSAQTQISLESTVEPGYTVLSQPCDSGQVSMPEQGGSLVASVIMTSAPAGYPHPLPYNVSFNIIDGQFVMGGLPAGVYNFTVISVCGDTYQYTVEIQPSPEPLVILNSIKGCAVGEGSIRIEVLASVLTSASITTAPSTFPFALPYDITSNLDTGVIYMNGLPEGAYTFFLQDQCSERSALFQISGYQELVNNVVVDANCGSFNISIQYQSNESSSHEFWLQRLNVVTGQWEHPLTSVAYTNGSIPDTSNSYALFNNTNNLNIVSIGTFRILRTHQIFANGSMVLEACIEAIEEFIFTGGPRIIDAYALPCAGGFENIVIIAEGIAPLQYSITLKDNLPFVVNNGTSNIFTGLTAGLYNFQVEDVCGNIVNRLLDLGTVPPPTISQSGICTGQPGALSITNFPFLSYQWWSASNPSVILSTTNTLNFNPFTQANSGMYFVRYYSSVGTLCADQTLSYTIPPSGTLPNAGNGTTTYICSSTAAINLYSLLETPYDSNGVWTETTNSGALIGNNWLSNGTPYGTYQFIYTVNGLCGATDAATVLINYNAMPSIPTASTDAGQCDADAIQLFADNPGSMFQYQWTGPNGFTSDLQNPILTNADSSANGIYLVTAAIGGCVSAAASVEISIADTPNFVINGGCNGNEFVLTATPENDSFGPTTVSYLWKGPQDFTSTSNPIVITNGISGSYTVTMTTASGCFSTSTIEVQNTMCRFPMGVSPNNDAQNDRFDLSGFGVLKLEIFNRYGRLVYEQDNYTNQWYGQDFKDRVLPDATYYYYIRLKSGEERTGWVYVTK